MNERSRLPRKAVVLLVALGLAAASCGGSGDSPASTAPTSEASVTQATAAEPVAVENDGFPRTFTNCDVEFTLDSAPERVLIMEAAVPSLLFAAGAIDRVVARIDDFPEEYYTPDEMAILNALPDLQAEFTSTGGAMISIETIIDYEPDIVIGYDTETLTRDSLGDVGIHLYVMPPFCDNPPEPSFQSIVDEVRLYGRMFGTEEIANASAVEMEAAVAAASGSPVAEGKTAVALAAGSDGGAIYAYSSLGMVHPLIEAHGMTNLFADFGERVFEVSVEEIIDRNPDILIILYWELELTPEEVIALVTDRPGADRIKAVADGEVYPLMFNFAEPPSPIVVKGLSVLGDQIAGR